MKTKLEQLEEKYLTGKYDLYTLINTIWCKRNEETKPSFGGTLFTYKLILKEHSHIANAVIDNSKVKIEWLNPHIGFNRWEDESDFFNKYNEELQYRIVQPTETELTFKEHKDVAEPLHGFGEPLSCKVCHKVKALNIEWLCVECATKLTKKKHGEEVKCDGKWNDHHIKASQKAYDKLVDEGYKPQSLTGWTFEGYFYIQDNTFVPHEIKDFINEFKIKPFYLVDGEFTEQQPALENGRPEIILPMSEYHIAFCNDGKMPEVMIYSVETQCVTEIRLNPFEITKRKKKTMDEIKEESIKEGEKFNKEYSSSLEKIKSANNAQVKTIGEEDVNRSMDNSSTTIFDSNISKQNINETISIKDSEGKEAHFAKFGFEVPDFECELFAVRGNKIYGMIYDKHIDYKVYPMIWNIKGFDYSCIFKLLNEGDYNLTPIKTKWHEDEKAKEILQNVRKNITLLIEYVDDIEFAEKLGDFRQNLDSLYCKE